MVEIVWTETSLLNINEIAEYISQDSVFYAQILVDNFFKIEKKLMEYPRSGRMIPEAGYDDSLREIIEGNYRIFYEIKSEFRIEILAVYHSARNIVL
jgi:toxin ParE1/3/4